VLALATTVFPVFLLSVAATVGMAMKSAHNANTIACVNFRLILSPPCPKPRNKWFGTF